MSNFLRKEMYADPAAERERFRTKVRDVIEAGEPLHIQAGFGRHPQKGFLNLDFRYRIIDGDELRQVSIDYHEITFVFDWPKGLPVPDDSVDFFFHEDMYEHLDQKEQYYLLAEVLRVLKPGGFHRINCPNLEFIMKTQSDFTQGHKGIFDEWEKWHHKCIPTKTSLEEQARIVGYSNVHFNGKNKTVSGVKFRERRPDGTRDQDHYNIFVDLEK